MAEFLIDSYSEVNQDEFYWIFSVQHTCGQSFTVSKVSRLSHCKFYLKKFGTPAGNIVAQLYAHSGTYGTSSLPTGPILATSDNFDIATLTTSYALIDFTFSGINKYLLHPDYYCIQTYYTGGDGSNYGIVGVDGSTPSHSGNTYLYTGSMVALSGYDTPFYVYGEEVSTGNFFIFLCEAYQRNKKYFKKKGLYLPEPKGILIPEGI